MIINHNLSAMYSHRQFKINTIHTQKNIEKLASGMRINRAGDDAAGLAVSEKMRAQIRGLHQASRNAQDGISFVQTAEGYLNETQAALQRMRELAVQASNGIYTYEDRMQIKTEIEQLVDEIDRIASHAEFNTLKLLRGGFRREPKNENYNKGVNETFPYDPALVQKQAEAPVRPIGATDPQADPDENEHALVRSAQVSASDPGGIHFHIGANMDQREKVYIENMSAVALGLAKSGGVAEASQRPLLVSYLTQDGANRAIAQLDSALYVVGRQRADLGAYQNRLEHAVRAIDNAAENLQASESQIRDVDMAQEMVEFVKNQILSQSSSSMLAQANLRAQVVLRILG